MVLPKLEWAVKRDRWRKGEVSGVLTLVSEIDDFLASVEEYRYARKETVVDVGLPTLVAYEEKYLNSHWEAVIAHYKIRPDLKLYKLCCEWSSRNQIDPNAIFLGTWKIDPDASYHDHLLGRVRDDDVRLL